MPSEVYTYRAGKKVVLEKQPSQFAVRSLSDELQNTCITDAEQVSSASSRVTVCAMDLEPMMSRTSNIVPTPYVYAVANTGEHCLIGGRDGNHRNATEGFARSA